jgi:hypothetical protein
MKQFKAITVDGEMALQELPQMLQPLSYSNDEWDEYLRLLAIIKVAPEYKDFWKEGDVVSEDEFVKMCKDYKTAGTFKDCDCTDGICKRLIAIPKPKEDEGALWEEISNNFRQTAHDYKDGKFDYRFIWKWFQGQSQHYSITKKTTTP